jgi:hypothetical protein
MRPVSHWPDTAAIGFLQGQGIVSLPSIATSSLQPEGKKFVGKCVRRFFDFFDNVLVL